MGICETLGVIFIVLKLLGVISWSWWAVTCPIWGILLVYIIVVIVAFWEVKGSIDD